MDEAQLEAARSIADREPVPQSWPEELARAQEVIQALGDLPQSIAYEMCMRAPLGVNPIADIDAMRGPGAPDYPPTDRR